MRVRTVCGLRGVVCTSEGGHGGLHENDDYVWIKGERAHCTCGEVCDRLHEQNVCEGF
jgi:hypothetical protein